MAIPIDKILRKIKQRDGSTRVSEAQREAIEFFGNPTASIDAVSDAKFNAMMSEIGGVDAATELRSIARSFQRKSAVEMVKEEMLREAAESGAIVLPPRAELVLQARQALGLTDADADPVQRLAVCECIALAHRAATLEVAEKFDKDGPSPLPPKTTLLSGDNTTILMARSQPQWVIERDQQLASLFELNAEQARIYSLHVHAGCDVEEISQLLMDEQESTAGRAQDDIEHELDAARAFCIA